MAFTEVLKLKPRLDEADAKKAELSLSQRFGRVARRFGTGLKTAIKGTILGIGLGLLAKLLNPLNELEDRIKKLLGQAEDTRDLADKYGATEGQVLKLQALAESSGLKPDQLEGMMEAFRKAVEEERALIDSGKATKEQAAFSYANDKNLLEGFFTFVQSLKTLGDANPAGRRNIERQVFGDTLFGAQRRFVDTNFSNEVKGLPSADAFQNAAENAVARADQLRRATVRNESNDFIRSGNSITASVVQGILQREQRERDKDFAQLQGYETLKRAADAIEILSTVIQGIQTAVINGLSTIVLHLGNIGAFFKKIEPYVPGFLKSYGGKK